MLIEKLTPEQEALLPIVRDRWLKIGLSTEPAKREEAEEGVRLAYKTAGLAPPKFMVWLSSPMAGACAAYMFATKAWEKLIDSSTGNPVCAEVWGKVLDQVGEQVRNQLWYQVWEQVGAQALYKFCAQFRDHVCEQVWEQVGDQFWDQVWEQVWVLLRAQVCDEVVKQVSDQFLKVWYQACAQVGDQVGEQVRDQVREQVLYKFRAQVRDRVLSKVQELVQDEVRDQVKDLVSDQVRRCCYGQHDANWLSWVDFFREINAPIENLSRLEGLIQIAQSCGWWWTFENVCILTERPTALHRDERHRLHNERGMAIQYPDGWGMYAWHGVRVPERVITSPESLTPQEILAEENVEVRRVMIERYGLERFLEQSNAQECDSSEFGTLYKIRLPDDELAVVRVTCPSTGRKYVLPVSPQVRTAREAVASTFGLSEQEYQPSVQT
jgi:hypothetical protein